MVVEESPVVLQVCAYDEVGAEGGAGAFGVLGRVGRASVERLGIARVAPESRDVLVEGTRAELVELVVGAVAALEVGDVHGREGVEFVVGHGGELGGDAAVDEEKTAGLDGGGERERGRKV